MNKIETFQSFLENEGGQIVLWGFVFDLMLAALLAFVLGRVYVRYGLSLSNRQTFAKNFIMLSMTTMFIISIVKSSLALSLGLVGALSIVRFRAAIKEPEELSYLFLAIAIGLGLGADQRAVTLMAFVVIVGVIFMKSRFSNKDDRQNLHLTVMSKKPGEVDLDSISRILRDNCTAVNLKRYDETEDMLEASFLVEFESVDNLNEIKTELQELNSAAKITFLDNKSVIV